MPAIVYVHGGPTSQTVNSFNRFIQYVANQGYIVIAPNYRGSTGYGKEFQQANLFDMGGGDLQDVLRQRNGSSRPAISIRRRLILMGGSYGGYMTMMGVTKAPDVWAAGVPIVPFVNYFTEIENEDPVLREMDLATMGDPEKNKELYPRPLADFLRRPDQGSTAAPGGRKRPALSQRRSPAGGGRSQEARRRGRVQSV